jgi:hypothetical protein
MPNAGATAEQPPTDRVDSATGHDWESEYIQENSSKDESEIKEFRNEAAHARRAANKQCPPY